MTSLLKRYCSNSTTAMVWPSPVRPSPNIWFRPKTLAMVVDVKAPGCAAAVALAESQAWGVCALARSAWPCWPPADGAVAVGVRLPGEPGVPRGAGPERP